MASLAGRPFGAMTTQEQNLYVLVKGGGEQGLTVKEMCEGLGVSRAAIYNHLKALVEYGKVSRLIARRDGQIVYAADQNSVMHILPGAGTSMPALPVASYLKGWLGVNDVNDTLNMKHFKRFPMYLSQLCQFAVRWNIGDRESMPFRDEQNQLRENILTVSVRAKLLHEMCESILNDPILWSSQKAYHSWFMDPNNVFTVEDAKRIHNHLITLMEGN